MYDIVNNRGHYEIYYNDELISTADTYGEAEEEIKLHKKERNDWNVNNRREKGITIRAKSDSINIQCWIRFNIMWVIYRRIKGGDLNVVLLWYSIRRRS